MINLLLIGLPKDHPLAPQDTIELCDQLLRRCAQANQGFSIIKAEKEEAKRKAEELGRIKAEQDAKLKAEEQARIKAEKEEEKLENKNIP